MRNSTLITALLLCSLSWISVSLSQSQTVEVQPGEEVTLLCSNYTSSPSLIMWFRVVSRTQPQCICSMFKHLEGAKFCSGFENGKFEMTSNSSTLFLKIKQVDLSDSGLYFCGYRLTRGLVIVHATYLQVEDVFEGITKLMSVMLGGLTVFLIMVVICLAVQIKKLQKALVEERSPQGTECRGSDDVNYAAVTYRLQTERNHRPVTSGQVEPNVIYAATR
ncbi:uncharacterized protein LOC121626656 [Chelmon rostratus]|uniref:uncharacterized protein LOC121626656 n=1 Tax=Chelmon rostratus TaxID=109905 RepID=UPI001BE9265E|nr:uncharacterized protein LOC121626656 [Chelmon rostratus]